MKGFEYCLSGIADYKMLIHQFILLFVPDAKTDTNESEPRRAVKHGDKKIYIDLITIFIPVISMFFCSSFVFIIFHFCLFYDFFDFTSIIQFTMFFSWNVLQILTA